MCAAEPSNPHLGTWKLNEAKSKFEPGAVRNETVTYTDAGKSLVKLEVNGVDGRGNGLHWTWKGRFDGKPEKVLGNTTLDTLAIKVTGPNTLSNIATKNGKIVAESTVELAHDGKSRTVKTIATDQAGRKVTSIVYYDKR